MLNLKDKLKENLAKKKIWKISIWYMCISIIENFFDKKFKIKLIEKNNILIIKPFPNYAWSEIYKNKDIIIKKINNNLKDFWINKKIKDIIIK